MAPSLNSKVFREISWDDSPIVADFMLIEHLRSQMNYIHTHCFHRTKVYVNRVSTYKNWQRGGSYCMTKPFFICWGGWCWPRSLWWSSPSWEIWLCLPQPGTAVHWIQGWFRTWGTKSSQNAQLSCLLLLKEEVSVEKMVVCHFAVPAGTKWLSL